MTFAEFSLAEAEGIILAHTLRLAGTTLKKGKAITAADIVLLRDAGIAAITGARLEAGDVGEDAAATAIAAAMVGENVLAAAPFMGRCNLFATAAGVVAVDRQRIDTLNDVDESVTVATAEPWTVAQPGQILATIKIIPYAAPGPAVAACQALAAAGGPAMSVKPFLSRAVSMVRTALPGDRPAGRSAIVSVSRARVEALGGLWLGERNCVHDPASLATAIGEALAGGCELLLISGAAATADRRDVVPAAITLAGGTVDHFGLLVDPGNLLLLGHIGAVPVIGLPGCAASAQRNGLDLVLPRLMAGLPVSRRDISGAGGLLKEIAGRPQPRAGQPVAAPRVPRLAAIVLAAGQSTRMGHNKLMAQVAGKPLVMHAADAALAAHLAGVVVVTGHEAQRIHDALADRPLTWTHNPDYADGMAGSLKAGLAALPAGVDGVVVCLGDMPAITADHIERLAAAFDPEAGRAMCVPVFGGKRGNPVLLARRFFAEMQALTGDHGARRLIAEHDDVVCEVDMPDDAILRDVDDAATLAALHR